MQCFRIAFLCLLCFVLGTFANPPCVFSSGSDIIISGDFLCGGVDIVLSSTSRILLDCASNCAITGQNIRLIAPEIRTLRQGDLTFTAHDTLHFNAANALTLDKIHLISITGTIIMEALGQAGALEPAGIIRNSTFDATTIVINANKTNAEAFPVLGLIDTSWTFNELSIQSQATSLASTAAFLFQVRNRQILQLHPHCTRI
jgi:hypothetical protein